MALQSLLFRDDLKLEAATVSDPAHIEQGARGEHVRKIQQALVLVDGAAIKPDGQYGPATAAAVLAYKRKRGIINRTYQTQADDIVGKMTIAALDKEVLAREGPIPGAKKCVLLPPAAIGNGTLSSSALALPVRGGVAARASDADIMSAAFRRSRTTVQRTADDLFDLTNAIRSGKPLSPKLTKTFNVAAKWLKFSKSDQQAALPTLDEAKNLMIRNLNRKTTAGPTCNCGGCRIPHSSRSPTSTRQTSASNVEKPSLNSGGTAGGMR